TTPHWTPGSSRGYHALTYGFIVDQLIRRLHPKAYTVPQIYQEEIWEEGEMNSLCKRSDLYICNFRR
ncbi:hypothetical protein COOONC_15071, partial [Cooperia oncophora]